MQPEEPTGPSLEKQRPPSEEDLEEEERRRNAADNGVDAADAASDGCSACDLVPSCDGPGRLGSGCDTPGCDTPDCDCNFCDGCNLLVFVRLSSLLLIVAAVVPERGGARLVRALLRFYRRRLTRFTPACPSTPSCSAYATAAVESLGVRRGLAAAARRVRDCGQPSSRATMRST